MKRAFTLLACALSMSPLALFSADKATANSAEKASSPLTTEQINRVSETFGHLLVQNLNDPVLQLNIKMVIQGMQDELTGKSAPLSEQEYVSLINQLQEQGVKTLAAKNLAAAEDFLKKNAKEKGVISLEDGKVEYLDIAVGEGDEVKAHSTPLIFYTGTLLDGTVFSATDGKEPIALPLDQTIPGFADGVIGMKEKGKRKLFIHPDLAYGTSGQLPPNSLLIFEVEIVKANSDQEGEEIVVEEEEVEVD